MQNANSFINWLEGFLDASKNNVTPAQIKEIRKKMKEIRESSPAIVALYDSNCTTTTNNQINDEFLKEVESRRNAATMEELQID